MIDKDAKDACVIRDEIKAFLKQAAADEGSSLDTGGGLGGADLWFTVGGREYILNIKPTKTR